MLAGILCLQGVVTAAGDAGVLYSRMSEADLETLLRPKMSDTRGSHEHDDELLPIDEEHLSSRGSTPSSGYGSSQGSSRRQSIDESVSSSPAPVAIVEPVSVADTKPSQEAQQAIKKVAQQQKRSLFGWLFRRKQTQPKIVVSDTVFERDITTRLSTTAKEVRTVDPSGLRFLDASLNKKLSSFEKKFNTVEQELNGLLKQQKNRKQVLKLIATAEKLRSDMQVAVNKVTQGFSGKAGKAKLVKLAQDPQVIDAVITSGSKSAMELLLVNGAKITKAQVEQTLKNHQYSLFRLFEEEGVNVEGLDPKVTSDLFETSVKQGDVDGVMIAYKLTPEASKGSSVAKYLKQLDILIKARSEAIDILALRVRRKNSPEAQLDTEQVASMKKALETLQGIEYFLLDKQVRIVALDLVKGTGQGFDFQSVADEESRASLEGVYTDFLESLLRFPTTTPAERIRIRKALGKVDPAADAQDYAQLVAEQKEGALNFQHLPPFLQNMPREQLEIFEDAYRQELEKQRDGASDKTKKVIDFALGLTAQLR